MLDRPGFTIDRVLTDPRLFGAALGDLATWSTWIAVLKAAFGLPLDDEQRSIFEKVAGGRAPPTQRVRELWCVAGRRSAKTRMAAATAVYLALFQTYKLAPGERGMVLILAASREQAKVALAYALAFLEASPVLAQEVVDVTAHEIRLRNGITIATHANSFRTARGRTLCACVFDEVSVWRDETSSAPDVETYRAVLPSLLTTRGMLIGISTGFRKIGLLHQKHRDFFGRDDPDTLVIQGGTTTFNLTITEADIAPQRAADPAAAASEWDGLFRDDISGFLDDDMVEAVIDHNRPLELPRQMGGYYQAFTDAAGGTGGDSYTVAVAHREGAGEDEVFVVDVVRGTRGKFDPNEVTKEYAELLKSFRISTVSGDKYGAEWVAGAWKSAGINYVAADLTKSEIYLATLPLFTARKRKVFLPNHPTLLRELRLLERANHRGGRVSVDHPRAGHDDFANATCGVLQGLSAYLAHGLDYATAYGTDDGISAYMSRYAYYLHSGGMQPPF